MTKQADNLYFTGIDIGSTTAKVVVQDGNNRVVFARYQRHQGETVKTVRTRRFMSLLFRRWWPLPALSKITILMSGPL